MSSDQQALVLDFGGVISRTLFETHALSEQALGLPPGTLNWQGPFDPAGDTLWRRMQADEISERDYWMARTREVVGFPDDLTAFVEGRSSIGRLGLFIQNAGWVDPGFEGSITLELYNGLSHTIELRAGWRVCQLVVVRMEGDSEGGYQGKYQGQVATTGSKLFQDRDGSAA